MSTRRGLRIDTSGLRQRIRNVSDNYDEDDNKEYIYLQMRDNSAFIPNAKCALYGISWIASLITVLIILQHYQCPITEKLVETECRVPDIIMNPVLMNHVIAGMKTNRRVRGIVRNAVLNGLFSTTSIYKKYLHGLYIDLTLNSYITDTEINHDSHNVEISAIVYANQYNSRIGEVGIPLTALYYENSIDQMVIIDDTMNHQTAELWEQEILFDQQEPSKLLHVEDLDEITKYKYQQWDKIDKIKKRKQFLRTSNVGISKGYEIGSKLTLNPKPIKNNDDIEYNDDIELLLLLDTYHQLPMDDEWITNALALFKQYPKLKVLGGFNGIIKNGNTFGDVNFHDSRTRDHDKEAQVFIMSRKSKLNKQSFNKHRYSESRVNIVEMLDHLKDKYYDKYFKSFWSKARKIYKTGNAFNDDDDDDTNNNKPVGLFSMNFLNDFDSAVFLDESDPDYDYNKVQTGLESIEFTIKKRFLEKYEKLIEDNLPIPAKILKEIDRKRRKCIDFILNDENDQYTEKEKEECNVLIKPGGQTNFDYYFIPYEQQITRYDELNDRLYEIYIPFMFITSVRMGPIFIRKDWWFNQLLPNLTKLEKKIADDKANKDWFDIEISLLTWSLGGYVGLYDAEGFKFDHNEFELGLQRNRDIDHQWQQFQDSHHLNDILFNIWNVTHLFELNENKNNHKMQLRTSVKATSDNPAHPTALDNSRQILLTLKQFEQVFENDNDDDDNQRIIRLRNQKQNNKFGGKNPLN